ncbi:MAG TPA: L,D-transpeptidase family protein [Gaiellaceae bacterium]|nr:L,D-transpeptidase family protein [Gaiellaceae bacterium]
MRRGIPLALLVLVWPSPAPAGAATPALTLKAPPATTYLHGVDFYGRLSPPAADARVRLMRGDTVVTTARTGPRGGYHFAVRLANPGPFHVAWLTARSPEVTVRITPRLHAALVGSKVAGASLKLAAALEPSGAGRVRVQVIRGGRVGFDRSFPGGAKVALGTRATGTVRVRLTSLPRPGWGPVRRELSATLRPPNLAYGTTDPAVAELARRLAALHYAVPSFSATFGNDFMESVWAFQKVQGVDRTGSVDANLWARLDNPRVPRPRYLQPANHIEVDKSRQVLYVVRNGEITLISAAATAGIAGYYTPEGKFAIYDKRPGWDHSPLGVLWNPMYFVGGYAIHGGDPVPPYPASHGCVRVPDFVISRLFGSEPYGEVVYVYS